MKYLYLFISLLITHLAIGQVQTTFEANTTLMIGENAIFYTGANTVFSGGLITPTDTLGNIGEIIAYSDLDFVANQYLGDLRLVGNKDQTIKGNTNSLFIDHLIINKPKDNGKQTKVLFETRQVIVKNSLSMVSGVIKAEPDVFVNRGTFDSKDGKAGYISGEMVATITPNEPMTFPIGVGDFANYVTLTSSTPDVQVKVVCKEADINDLPHDEDTQGLAKEVEWTIQTLSGMAEVFVTVEYDGVDLENLSNKSAIRANAYSTSLQFKGKMDTVFHALNTVNTADTKIDGDLPTNGIIVTNDKITVTTEPQRLVIGITPTLIQQEFFLPNVFSPKSNKVENNIFKPFYSGAEVSYVYLKVYDTFNKEVYSVDLTGTDLDLTEIGWNGQLASGLDAPEGVYYYNLNMNYTITVEGANQGKSQSFNKIGTVMLIK